MFTKPDEKVIIQPPVYHPFRLTPEGNRREVVFNPLRRREDGYYDMDFANLEKVCDDKCRVLVLCNPHNPAGLCWSEDTLKRLADFCYEHHIIVISDEIHSDMALLEIVMYHLRVCQSMLQTSVSRSVHLLKHSIWQE